MFEVLSIGLISLLGAMSPGPDFAIVTRHALTGSRKAAILTSLGIAAALLVHVTYCSLGVAIVLTESPLLFRLIQIAGSIYLGYLGIKLLIDSKGSTPPKPPHLKKAFFSGFLTNLLNPKATLFILSIYTQFVNVETPIHMQIIYGLVIAGAGLLWFCALSLFITHRRFLSSFARFQKVLMKAMGIVLLLLAAFVLFSIIFSKNFSSL